MPVRSYPPYEPPKRDGRAPDYSRTESPAIAKERMSQDAARKAEIEARAKKDLFKSKPAPRTTRQFAGDVKGNVIDMAKSIWKDPVAAGRNLQNINHEVNKAAVTAFVPGHGGREFLNAAGVSRGHINNIAKHVDRGLQMSGGIAEMSQNFGALQQKGLGLLSKLIAKRA